MQPLDIIGAIIGLFYIVSEYRADRWFWPLSMLMSAFYAIIDFQACYFANGAICVYNFLMSVYGILVWRGIVGKKDEEPPITSCPRKYWLPIIAAVALLSLALWWFLSRFHQSEYPVIDGISSALTIVAMWMLSQKWWQQWFCWIIVEPLMIALFWLSGNYASAVLYVVFEVFCILGILKWRRESLTAAAQKHNNDDATV